MNTLYQKAHGILAVWSIICHTDEAECKCHCAQIMPIYECLNLLCNVHYNNYTCLLTVYYYYYTGAQVHCICTLLLQLDYTQCTQNANALAHTDMQICTLHMKLSPPPPTTVFPGCIYRAMFCREFCLEGDVVYLY